MFKKKLIELNIKLSEIKEESIDFTDNEETDFEYLQENIFNSQDSIGLSIHAEIKKILTEMEYFNQYISSTRIEDTDLFKNIARFEEKFEIVYICAHDKFWEVCKTIIEEFFEKEISQEEEQEHGKLKNKKLLLLEKLNEISNILFPKKINSEAFLDVCSQNRNENNSLICDKCNFRLNNDFSIRIGLESIEFEEINIDNQGNLINSEYINKKIKESIEKYIIKMFFESLEKFQEGSELSIKINNYLKNKMTEIKELLTDMLDFLEKINFIADNKNFENNPTEFEEKLEKIIELIDKSDLVELLKIILNLDISEYEEFKEQYSIYELNDIIHINENYFDDLSQGLCVELATHKFKEELRFDGNVLIFIDEDIHNNLQFKDIFTKLEEINIDREVVEILPDRLQENQNENKIERKNFFDPYNMIKIKESKYKKKIWLFLRKFVRWGYFLGDLEDGRQIYKDLMNRITMMGIIKRENGNFALRYIISTWNGSIRIKEIKK